MNVLKMARETSTSELDEILVKDNLTKKDVILLLELKGHEELSRLFTRADEVRKEFIGDAVFVRGVIEFSNHCGNNCLYCGIRNSNSRLIRYRIKPDEIVKIAVNAVNKLGFTTVLLQSGEDDYYSTEVLEDVIKKILSECDCRVALSIGERGFEDYSRFFEAGARRCLIRFETSNTELFECLHPKTSPTKNSFEERSSLIKKLRLIGFHVGSGSLIGLPGQRTGDLAEDILFYDKYNINMAGMGPFIPHPDTPLAAEAGGVFEACLKMMAVTRIACKDIFISATTALQTLNPKDGRERALKAGANLIMPNITPKKYRRHYQLYPNKVCIYETPHDCRNCIRRVIASVDRLEGDGYGDPIRR